MVALGLAASFSGTVLAATPQGHESHSASPVELTHDSGQKWQTDEALRRGMGRIRNVIDASLPCRRMRGP